MWQLDGLDSLRPHYGGANLYADLVDDACQGLTPLVSPLPSNHIGEGKLTLDDEVRLFSQGDLIDSPRLYKVSSLDNTESCSERSKPAYAVTIDDCADIGARTRQIFKVQKDYRGRTLKNCKPASQVGLSRIIKDLDNFAQSDS